MCRVVTLLILVLLTLASTAGWLLLTEGIRSGEMEMYAGERRLEQGKDTLKEGHADLAAGKENLAEGKEEYKDAKDRLFLVWMDKLLNGGKGFEDAERRMAKGSRKVAAGEEKVGAGEERVAVGELRLSQGDEQLIMARAGRMACAVATGGLAILSIILGFRWRRALANVFTHTRNQQPR